jgi:hypothetical protein
MSLVRVHQYPAREKGTCKWCKQRIFKGTPVAISLVGLCHARCAAFVLRKESRVATEAITGYKVHHGLNWYRDHIYDRDLRPHDLFLPDEPLDPHPVLWDECEEFDDVAPLRPTLRYVHGEWLPSDHELRDYITDKEYETTEPSADEYLRTIINLYDAYTEGVPIGNELQRVSNLINNLPHHNPYYYQDWAWEYAEDPDGFLDWLYQGFERVEGDT